MENNVKRLVFAPESTAEGSPLIKTIDDYLKVVQCDTPALLSAKTSLPSGLIQLTFNLKGGVKKQFGPHYAQEMGDQECMLLYNPEKDLDYTFELEKGGKCLMLFLTVNKLHSLLMAAEGEIDFLDASNVSKKYYMKNAMGPGLRMSMEELFGTKMSGLSSALYLKSKSYECISHFFNAEEQEDYIDKCPFLKDQRNLEAVRKSKELLINNMAEPMTIKELSREVGLNEYQLKLGFKNIYGATMHNYLLDYKLNHALKLMVTDGMKVQEAADEIGYSNPSHFISAFKKKFGSTPKQYLKK